MKVATAKICGVGVVIAALSTPVGEMYRPAKESPASEAEKELSKSVEREVHKRSEKHPESQHSSRSNGVLADSASTPSIASQNANLAREPQTVVDLDPRLQDARMLAGVNSRETALDYLDAALRRLDSTAQKGSDLKNIEILRDEDIPKDFLAALPATGPGQIRTIARVDGRFHVLTGQYPSSDLIPPVAKSYLTVDDVEMFRVKLYVLEFEAMVAQKPRKGL